MVGKRRSLPRLSCLWNALLEWSLQRLADCMVDFELALIRCDGADHHPANKQLSVSGRWQGVAGASVATKAAAWEGSFQLPKFSSQVREPRHRN